MAWPNGYTYRRTLTVDNTKVSGTGDLTNFPILFSGTYTYLKTTGNGGNVQSATGLDIIFTSDANGSIQLAHEQESYGATTGAVNYWVRIPTLDGDADTVIYLFYGKSGVSDTSDPTTLWSSYLSVWHLKEDPSGGAPQMQDS